MIAFCRKLADRVWFGILAVLNVALWCLILWHWGLVSVYTFLPVTFVWLAWIVASVWRLFTTAQALDANPPLRRFLVVALSAPILVVLVGTLLVTVMAGRAYGFDLVGAIVSVTSTLLLLLIPAILALGTMKLPERSAS